jgi:hypothetical protein
MDARWEAKSKPNLGVPDANCRGASALMESMPPQIIPLFSFHCMIVDLCDDVLEHEELQDKGHHASLNAVDFDISD